jgi:predicted nucleic acid-binding protein
VKILVDANVALDVLLERHPHYISGTQILGLSKGGIELFVSASTVTDIYYIIRKNKKSKTDAIDLLKTLLASVDIAAVRRFLGRRRRWSREEMIFVCTK